MQGLSQWDAFGELQTLNKFSPAVCCHRGTCWRTALGTLCALPRPPSQRMSDLCGREVSVVWSKPLLDVTHKMKTVSFSRGNGFQFSSGQCSLTEIHSADNIICWMLSMQWFCWCKEKTRKILGSLLIILCVYICIRFTLRKFFFFFF